MLNILEQFILEQSSSKKEKKLRYCMDGEEMRASSKHTNSNS